MAMFGKMVFIMSFRGWGCYKKRMKTNRLIRVLKGRGETSLSAMEPAIIVADDLSPSETVQMDKEKIHTGMMAVVDGFEGTITLYTEKQFIRSCRK